MVCTLRKRESLPVSKWAGGTTTELFLYPADGSYADRRFQLRVSTATVELDSSQFSDLSGFRRLIMPLAGEMRLVHENQYDRDLSPYEVEAFDGGWHTRSFGRCTDFNAIFSPEWKAAMTAVFGGQLVQCPAGGVAVAYGRQTGVAVTVACNSQQEAFALNEGDVLVVESAPQEYCTLEFSDQVSDTAAAVVVTARVCCGKE